MINFDTDSRRESPRVNCRWTVKCVTEQKKVFETRSINISQGGVQIFAPMAFKKGERLYIEIKGYSGGAHHMIKAVGLVAYVAVSNEKGIQLGLKFVSTLTIQDSKFIQNYVKVMLGG